MTLARVLRVLLALALLSAQQLALSHQIWHFGKQDSDPAQEQICCHHDALGTVAGAMDAPVAATAGEPQAEISICFAALPSATTPGLAPSSRGPPALL
jgi:hypothetical protein